MPQIKSNLQALSTESLNKFISKEKMYFKKLLKTVAHFMGTSYSFQNVILQNNYH